MSILLVRSNLLATRLVLEISDKIHFIPRLKTYAFKVLTVPVQSGDAISLPRLQKEIIG